MAETQGGGLPARVLARFIQIGDLHLGTQGRNDDRLSALQAAILYGRQRPLSAWLIPGDLNHSRMTIADGNDLDVCLQMAADHAPVILCYGNHDLRGDLDGFARLKAKWPILVVKEPKVLLVKLAIPDGIEWASIFVFPYPTRLGLVAAGVPADQIEIQARAALEAIFMDAVEKLAFEPTALPLMIGHANIAGAVASTGQPQIGREIDLTSDLLDRLGQTIYKGFNHIHKAQAIGGAFYAGSLCRLDWAEVDPKSFLEIVYGDASWGGFNGDGPENGDATMVWDLRRITVDIPPMYRVDGVLNRDGFSWRIRDCGCGEDWCAFTSAAAGTRAICESADRDWINTDVKVDYRYVAADADVLNHALVKAPFVNARRFESEPTAERTRAARAPDVIAAVTFDDKVKAFVKRSGVEWSPEMEAKLAVLQQPDEATFLAEVAREVGG